MLRLSGNEPFACYPSSGAVGVRISLHGHPSCRCRRSSRFSQLCHARPLSVLLTSFSTFSTACHRAPGGIAPSATVATRSSSTPPSSSCTSCTRRPTWTWSVSSAYHIRPTLSQKSSVAAMLRFWFHPTPPGLGMVLTAAFEFDPRSNKEATIRPTDNIEVPQVSVVATECLVVLLYRVRRDNSPPPVFLAADPWVGKH